MKKKLGTLPNVALDSLLKVITNLCKKREGSQVLIPNDPPSWIWNACTRTQGPVVQNRD